MAADIPCDICSLEPAAQLLTNLTDGNVLAIGGACLPQFYGHMTLDLFQAGEHKGPATKCQACRRFHERMTTPVAPLGNDGDDNGDGRTQVAAGQAQPPSAENNVSRETSGPPAGPGQVAGA